jgi:hypothetical protein
VAGQGGRGGGKLSARERAERARLRAAEQAEAFETRQRLLRELAVEYLMAGEELDAALESVQRRMEPLREEAEAARERAQRARYATVARMRELEASEPEVAERLGISLGEVRRSMAQVRAWRETDETAGAADLDGEDAGAGVPPVPVARPGVGRQGDDEDHGDASAADLGASGGPVGGFGTARPDLGGWQSVPTADQGAAR